MNRFQFSMTDLNRIIVAEAENGKTRPQLVAYLQQRGWPQAAAHRFVMNALRTSNVAEVTVASSPAGLAKQPAKSHGPSLASVAAWLTALSALLWALVDVAGRMSF